MQQKNPEKSFNYRRFSIMEYKSTKNIAGN